MAADALGSRRRYGRFALMQQAFHRDIDALFGHSALGALLSDLVERRRLPLIEQDLSDLGLDVPVGGAAFDADADVPTALGWLYVAEGSNLGAAFLLKEAAKLGLSETFGARHLTGAPEGRGLHWRTFTVALDAVPMLADEKARVVAGAHAAFARVQGLVEALVPIGKAA